MKYLKEQKVREYSAHQAVGDVYAGLVNFCISAKGYD